MRSKGATSSSFETIVASGERSALPHGVASDRMIGNNEFVKLDFGAYYKGIAPILRERSLSANRQISIGRFMRSCWKLSLLRLLLSSPV